HSPHGAHYVVEAERVGVVHRATSIRREAVSCEVYDVDVGGAQGDALLEDLRSLVDQREDAALDNLLGGDLAARDAQLSRGGDDQFVHHRVGDGVAPSRLVAVPAGGGIMAETAHLP